MRLVVPMKRSAQGPEYTARAVGVALFWALTPLIPVQMYLLGLTWLLTRRIPWLNFNLLVALAWIWVTNAFTMIPIYFVFYLTGQILLGRWDDLAGYGQFADQWQTVLKSADGFFDSLLAIGGMVVREQGAALAVGCLPYALGGGWLGYVLSLRFMRRFTERRQRQKKCVTS